MSTPNRTYLGDSVYAAFDGFHIVLSANDEEHVIYLDDQVQDALIHYFEKIHGVKITVEKVKAESA
jgi:hypothetical protein